MHVIYLVIGYAAVISIGVSVFLYGRPEGNSIFDKLYRLFCIRVPNAIKWVLYKILGPKGPKFLDKTWTYVCWESNPIVQIFYMLVLFGGYGAFVHSGYPHLPNKYASEYHKYCGFLSFAIAFTFWMVASFSDPGTITKKNARPLTIVYPYDRQIFHKDECRTCETLKPARSKHCALCDICVARFDHHCIWINNCVGLHNHRWFLGYLLANCILVSYGATVGTLTLYSIIEGQNLLTATFVDPSTGDKFKADYRIVLYFLVAQEGILCFVVILCMVMSVVLFGFFMWHLNLIKMGVTSNEQAKWRGLKCYLQEVNTEEAIKYLKTLNNIYQKGFWANLKEVLFPHNVHEIGQYYVPTKEDLEEDKNWKRYKAKKNAEAKAKKENEGRGHEDEDGSSAASSSSSSPPEISEKDTKEEEDASPPSKAPKSKAKGKKNKGRKDDAVYEVGGSAARGCGSSGASAEAKSPSPRRKKSEESQNTNNSGTKKSVEKVVFPETQTVGAEQEKQKTTGASAKAKSPSPKRKSNNTNDTGTNTAEGIPETEMVETAEQEKQRTTGARKRNKKKGGVAGKKS